jgi:hypothetical protein
MINSDLKIQLTDTHTGILKGLKLDCKATRYLLKMFSHNVDAVINDRMEQNPMAY